jgi:hypothetical protein
MPRLRILGPSVTLALALPISAPLAGQIHHVDRPQRVTRAVGVYEWTGDLAKPDAARLIPVSIFTSNQFQDAGVFLAQPVPLALETGTVYALQHSGDVFGTLDLDFARDIVDKRSSADDNPLGAWYGYGRFLPLSAAPVHKLPEHVGPNAAIVGSDDSDPEPHFVPSRHGDSGDTGTVAKSSSPAPPDDPDRPHMAKRSSDSDSTDNAPSSPGTRDVEDTGVDDPDRPTLGHRNVADNKKPKKSKASGSGVEPMPTSLNEDPDRPELHRGKVESATAPAQLTGLPPNLHQAVAVSDPNTPPQHVFARDWDAPTERAQTLAAMHALAQPLVRQYLATNHLTAAPAAGTGPRLATASSSSSASKSKSASATHSATHSTAHSTTHHTASKSAAPAPLTFGDEQIAGYTLSYGGLPTFVYSAALPTSAPENTDGPAVHVTVVAQRLPSGELQVSLSSVTDEQHLDRTPWLRLVDAVDPDDSHRADLLFELRARSSRQFALYSLASAQAQQTFITGLIE